MPTDLTPWPALLEAVAKRWPDAPKPPKEYRFDSDGIIQQDIGWGYEQAITGWAAEAFYIRWATEFGAWWEHQTMGARAYYIGYAHALDQWAALVLNGTGRDNEPIYAPTLLSAHAAAVGAIVGTP